MSTQNQTALTDQVTSTAQQEQTTTIQQGQQTEQTQQQQESAQAPGAMTLTQAELDKLISKGIQTATANLTSKFEEAQKRIKGLEAQNMTAEELAAQQQKEAQEASAARIAELIENNQRLQIKAKIAETGLPLDENLFVNTSLEIDDIFKNIDNMAKKYNDDLEKAIASKQSKAGAGIASKAGNGNQTTSSNQEYAKKVPWV
ncbi:hypothetical protein [Lactococcus allomyrinae]|uniref:DUF4355 domain-containing protein n=1 Tax=Lactococcus allomyrinae TaxID=2419773 RepID=A0A387BL52_9LACT|nr:hypothetical protein [Lactococcus allomyrinae]AYG01700.1 hypothetical protein D7I46_11935 [Lactococcus allomyrinae]